MMPVTQLAKPGILQAIHENIQELESHPLSHRQTFLPVSESRVFTRADAGKEFGLPPTEEAVSHPDLIHIHRDRIQGVELTERIAHQKERERLLRVQREEELRIKAEKKARMGTVVEQGRWVWKLTDATTGTVGHRYGVPHQDRKKGQVKIPTRVL